MTSKYFSLCSYAEKQDFNMVTNKKQQKPFRVVEHDELWRTNKMKTNLKVKFIFTAF